MTVLTVFADVSDGLVWSSNTTYLTARSSGTLTADTTNQLHQIGQTFVTPTYTVYEYFLAFDTSSVGAGSTVTQVDYSLFIEDASTALVSFTASLLLYDWSTTVTTADWIAGSSLSGLVSLATKSVTSSTPVAYLAFTENSTNFRDNLNLTGFTRGVMVSSRTQVGNAPTGTEYADIRTADQTGTTNDPKLVVTYTKFITIGLLAGTSLSGVAVSMASIL